MQQSTSVHNLADGQAHMGQWPRQCTRGQTIPQNLWCSAILLRTQKCEVTLNDKGKIDRYQNPSKAWTQCIKWRVHRRGWWRGGGAAVSCEFTGLRHTAMSVFAYMRVVLQLFISEGSWGGSTENGCRSHLLAAQRWLPPYHHRARA